MEQVAKGSIVRKYLRKLFGLNLTGEVTKDASNPADEV